MQILRKLTYPFALIYSLVVHIRNWLYDVGFLPSHSFGIPIVSVGNLSVGGTGKTPMTDYLVCLLKKHHKVAVLSRGYRRKSKGFLMANASSTVKDLGDEPYQLYTKHADISIAVDADRANGIKNLLHHTDAEIVILDDAFQHRRVRPSVSFLLTTYQNPFPKDFYLPMGNLRDAKKQYKRADVIIVTKCPNTTGKPQLEMLKKLIAPREGQLLLFSGLCYTEFFTGKGARLNYEELDGKNLALVTAIANSKPLVEYLAKKGLTFTHYKYRDHHYFSKTELETFKKHELVLTTEKDFTRLSSHLNHAFYIGIKPVFLEDGEVRLINFLQEKLPP